MTTSNRLTPRALVLLCCYAPPSGAIAAFAATPGDLVVAGLVGMAGLVHLSWVSRQFKRTA